MRISVLGSTGSVGRHTLQVVREIDAAVEVVALAAGRNVDELARQALEFRPALVSVADPESLARLRDRLGGAAGYSPRFACGPRGNLAAAAEFEYDVLVSAAVGIAGLEGTYEAVRLGRRIALANKEVLVAAGEAVTSAARDSGAEILPVDSEHNALHQCLRAGRADEVERVVLTASGGPFRTTPAEELARVTPERALRHPTWKMGSRITIDSATLMNKGFEVIEACHLFGLPPGLVDIVVHPQSVVHAMVEFRDGSVIAQLSPPDMKLPIRYALAYPDREPSPRRRMDWTRVSQLDFEPPDRSKFPLIDLAYEAARSGGLSGCMLNAADEVAVEAFLCGRISFPDIAHVVERTLAGAPSKPEPSVGDVLECDREARAKAREVVRRRPEPRPALGLTGATAA